MTRSDGTATKGLGLLFTLCLSAPALSPADERDEAGARVLFGEGRKLVDAGDYADACPKFEESLRLDPGVGTSFNLADCQEHIGRTASAWARFLDVAAATQVQGQRKREEIARARAVALEPKLVRLVVQVTSPAEGLVVERDGLLLGAASWGTPVPVDPGPHRLEARAPGKKDWSQDVKVPDVPTTVEVSVPALEPLPRGGAPSVPPTIAPPAALPEPSPARPPRLEPLLGRSSLPVVVLGVLGTAALATSAVFAFKVGSENGEATALCPGSTCASAEEKNRHDGLVEDAHRDRDVAYVTGGIGAAALVAAALVWWRPRAPSTQASAGRLSVCPMAGRLGADLKLAW